MNPSIQEIRQWIVRYLEQALELPGGSLHSDRPFASYGLSSRGVIELVGSLEDWMGMALDETLIYDHPTANGLSRQLHAMAARKASVP